MNKTIQIKVPEGKTNFVAVDKVDNRPVTERIKTFEDAMQATGMKLPLDENQLSCLPKDVVAYMKLRIIAAALNELEEETLDEFPKFTIDEWRRYPFFGLYTKAEIGNISEEKNKSLFMFLSKSKYNSYCCIAPDDLYNVNANSDVTFTARLAVKSQKLAFYFGTQFIDIWADFLT